MGNGNLVHGRLHVIQSCDGYAEATGADVPFEKGKKKDTGYYYEDLGVEEQKLDVLHHHVWADWYCRVHGWAVVAVHWGFENNLRETQCSIKLCEISSIYVYIFVCKLKLGDAYKLQHKV